MAKPVFDCALTAAFALLVTISNPAVAATHGFGPFLVDDEHPTLLLLNGQIYPDAPIDFDRAVREFPAIDTLGLNSPGGDVLAGLMLSLEVSRRGMSTLISTSSGCYSACAYVFLAGVHRQVDGELGTHAPTAEESTTEERVSLDLDMRYVLRQFDVPMTVWDTIFNTPNADLRVFDATEAEAIGLNR